MSISSKFPGAAASAAVTAPESTLANHWDGDQFQILELVRPTQPYANFEILVVFLDFSKLWIPFFL